MVDPMGHDSINEEDIRGTMMQRDNNEKNSNG